MQIFHKVIGAYAPGEWYTDKSFAIADAERRRKKKIASLQKQIAELEKITFDSVTKIGFENLAKGIDSIVQEDQS